MSLYGSILSICQSGCGFGNSLCTERPFTRRLSTRLFTKELTTLLIATVRKTYPNFGLQSKSVQLMREDDGNKLQIVILHSEWFTVRSLYSLIPLLIPLLPNSLYQVVPLYSDWVIARSPSCTGHKLMLPWRWQMHLAHGRPEMP